MVHVGKHTITWILWDWMLFPQWSFSLLATHISPPKPLLKDDFRFPKVGYVEASFGQGFSHFCHIIHIFTARPIESAWGCPKYNWRSCCKRLPGADKSWKTKRQLPMKVVIVGKTISNSKGCKNDSFWPAHFHVGELKVPCYSKRQMYEYVLDKLSKHIISIVY